MPSLDLCLRRSKGFQRDKSRGLHVLRTYIAENWNFTLDLQYRYLVDDLNILDCFNGQFGSYLPANTVL